MLVVLTLARSNYAYRLELRKIRFHMDLLGRIVRIGLPAGLQSVMYSLSNVIIQASVNGFGTDILAAWTAYGKLDGLYWMTVNAFGVAITTFVGQNFGAQRYDRVKKSVRACLGMTVLATAVISTVLLLFGETLYRLFSDDSEVIRLGLVILRLLVPTYLTYICIEVLAGAVRGAGDSLIPTLITLCGVACCGWCGSWPSPRHTTASPSCCSATPSPGPSLPCFSSATTSRAAGSSAASVKRDSPSRKAHHNRRSDLGGFCTVQVFLRFFCPRAGMHTAAA